MQIVKAATATVISRLDQNFFRVRFDRLTPGEKNFLRAGRVDNLATSLTIPITAKELQDAA